MHRAFQPNRRLRAAAAHANLAGRQDPLVFRVLSIQVYCSLFTALRSDTTLHYTAFQ